MHEKGWKRAVGREVLANQLLLGYEMARYQERKELNDASLAALLGTTKSRLADLAEMVIPAQPDAWAARTGVSLEGLQRLLALRKLEPPSVARDQPRRMFSIRLRESDIETVKALAERLGVSVTGVVEMAVRDLDQTVRKE